MERFAARHTLLFWENRGKVLNDFLRANLTDTRDCRARTREAMAASLRNHDIVYRTQFLGYAANLYLRVGAVAEGRAAIAEAFQLIKRTDPRFYSAELHRLDGELLRAEGAKAEVQEACFQQALLVRVNKARSHFELRAAMSLGRLWHSQRKGAQAHALITQVYTSFGDGFITIDLEDARALLDEWK